MKILELGEEELIGFDGYVYSFSMIPSYPVLNSSAVTLKSCD